MSLELRDKIFSRISFIYNLEGSFYVSQRSCIIMNESTFCFHSRRFIRCGFFLGNNMKNGLKQMNEQSTFNNNNSTQCTHTCSLRDFTANKIESNKSSSPLNIKWHVNAFHADDDDENTPKYKKHTNNMNSLKSWQQNNFTYRCDIQFPFRNFVCSLHSLFCTFLGANELSAMKITGNRHPIM